MTDIPEQKPEERPFVGRYVFECGAFFPSRDRDDEGEATYRRKKDGRRRIVVWDSDPKTRATRPRKEDDSLPPCLACPHKRAAGSKTEMCFPETTIDKDGRPIKWRYVTTCHPRWEPCQTPKT